MNRHSYADAFKCKMLCAALMLASTAALWLSPAIVRAEDQRLTLAALESELTDSPSLAAADTRIFSADQKVQSETEVARGFNYFFQNSLGPRNDIIAGTNTNGTFQYGQAFGVAFPLLGSRLSEHSAIVAAQSEANLARIQAAGERRTLLTKLRDSYIKYWQYDREQAVVARFYALEQAGLPSAKAFMREGFWTSANYMGFLDQISQFKTDLTTLQSSRRSALADIRAILNNDVPEQKPNDPDLEVNCSPLIDQAVVIAADNDAEIAQLQEQQREASASLDFVRQSSTSADFRVGVGTLVDIPQRTAGYNVTGTFSVSFPQHMRPEETARRQSIFGNIQTDHFLEMQRRSDIRAAIMNALDQTGASRSEYLQAKREEDASRETLREARVRWSLISAKGAATFNDVQAALLDSYAAARRAITDLGATYSGVNTIEGLVPNACVPFRLDGELAKP